MVRLSRSSSSDLPRRRQVPLGTRAPERPSMNDQQLFKRNRTLTGSASSRVVGAANETGSHLKSSRVHVHELANHRRRIGGSLLVVSAVALFLSVMLWQFTASISINTPGISSIPTPKYVAAIQDYYGQRPFERFRFAVNERQLTEHVQRTLPEVERIDIGGATGFSESAATVVMRKPIAGWKIGTTQYYVDANGASFTTNHHPSPLVQIIDESGVDLQLGQTIASNRFLGYVGRTVALTNAQQYKVTQVTIPANTTRQIELQIEGVGYPALLLIDRPVGEQVEDMVRSIRYFQQREQNPEYIDVRVSGKAFYR